jgi:hypothetical protein
MFLINAIQDLAINEDELEEPFPLLEGIYLAWTPSIVTQLISDRMKLAMGGLEYLDLIGGRSPAVFTYADAEASYQPLQILAVWHNHIYEFLFCLWLIKDNSLNAGLGFVFSINNEGKDVGSSNSRSASYTCADGCRRSVEFSKAEFVEARELYERLHKIGKGKKRPPTLRPVEQVEVTGMIISADAVRALSRASFFLDSARDCSDLSVKVAHYTTGLEVLFSTDSSEISHKLAERVALFLGDTFEERKRLFDRVKRLYSVSSKVVHGDVFSEKKTKSVGAISQDADDLLRRVMRRILVSEELCELFEGTPESKEEYFVDLVLRK